MEDDKLRNPFGRLLQFLDQLEDLNIHYDLKHVRETIMVRTYVPEGVWEIEFFEDGTLEVELFPRTEGVDAISEEWLDQFLDRFIEENRE